jgi:hypothetical protein
MMDLAVAIDVHGKLTAGSAPLASDARFSSRHCKGAPAMPYPSPDNGQYHHQPHQLLLSARSNTYWQNTPIGIWWS